MDIGKISSAGIGSGLDVNSIVTQLLALERKPIQLLGVTKTRLDAQLSGYGKLQASLGAVRDAARTLTDASAWTPTIVSSSDAAAVSAVSSGSSPPGNYAVEVTRLAAAQSVTSATVPGPTSVVGTGTLTIEMGRWFTDPPDFTPNAGGNSVSIVIAPGDDTLQKIRDRINASGAGVTASIVNDATGSRLALRSRDTGELNGFRITVADDDSNGGDASGLSMLAFDPVGGSSQMTQAQAASNAQLTINNIPVNSASNTLTDVLDGLTVRVSRLTTGPVGLSVNRDTETIKKSITGFADAYNSLVTLMREQTAYNESAKSAGTLQGDRTAVGLMTKLRTMIGSSTGATAAFTRLADIGLEPQRDGTLKLNTSKLDSALGRIDDLKAFFARDDDGTASDGFGTMLRQFADLTLGTDGAIPTKQEGLRSRIDDINKQTARMEDRLLLTEKRLRDQYTKLDSNMAALSGLQAYVSQQVTQWNRSTGN
ncbi:MAG: flagellar filament capping protein FliD [Rubrivivax sp.]